MNLPPALVRMEPRQLRLILGGAALLLLAALVMYLLVPQVKTYRKLTGDHALLLQAGDNRQALAGQLDAVKKEIQRLRQGLHGELGDLPATRVESVIVGKMQDISWRHQVNLVSIQPLPGEPVQSFQSLLFDVNVEGDYFALVNWLREVNQAMGFMVVEEYALTPIERPGEPSRLAMKLHMVAYRVTVP